MAYCFKFVWAQAENALKHPYFDDLDKATIDLLESKVIRDRETKN